jgi:NAD(P)-dependent dehydrogenase (short-subunit alcohol dehydrogenase family)
MEGAVSDHPRRSDLDGRTAIVTGGAGGIGLATARWFAERGSTVLVVDLDQARVDAAVAQLGSLSSGTVADITVESDVEAVVGAAVALGGRLDVLVNCGGVSDRRGPTLDKAAADWQRVIDVNLTGSYLMSVAAGRVMVEQGRGTVLNLCSIAGVLGLPARTAYSASKAGVAMMTRVLACEWAPHGVRVNAVAPGYIRTPMTDHLIEVGAIDVQAIERRTPSGAMGTPEDVAEVLGFLASDAASFVTGVVLPVDGGYMAYGAPGDAWTPPDVDAGD